MANNERLVALGIWAIGQDTRKKLGLPSEWNQENWLTYNESCGTACCIAGKVALEDGALPGFGSSARNGFTTSVVSFPDGGEAFVDEYAAQALELTSSQSRTLFSGSNDINDIVRLINQFTGVDLSSLVVTV